MARSGRSREQLRANALAARRCRERVKAEDHARESRLAAAMERNKQLIAANKELAECVRELQKRQQQPPQPLQPQQQLVDELDEERRMLDIMTCDGYIL